MHTLLDFSETPFYFYDLSLLETTLNIAVGEAKKYDYKLHYAIKANNNLKLLESIKKYGLGIDCVSKNEIKRVLELGFDSKSIVYAGVGKRDDEIELAIDSNIFCFNCESIEELKVISQIAEKKNKVATIALRINPEIDAHTHYYITTGIEENKFGINIEDLQIALDICRESDYLNFIGLHFHIGSQILNLEPYKKLCEKVNKIWNFFDISSYGGKIVNLGGGLGINYDDPLNNFIPDFRSYFSVFNKTLDLPEEIEVHFEPGRSLVGQCGRLITKVLYVKKGKNKNFIIVDAGMTELMRPTLYDAKHKIINISSSNNKLEKYDIVGPICESSDTFGKDIILPETKRGDIFQILSCGAYVESMTLNYNLRDKIKSIWKKE